MLRALQNSFSSVAALDQAWRKLEASVSSSSHTQPAASSVPQFPGPPARSTSPRSNTSAPSSERDVVPPLKERPWRGPGERPRTKKTLTAKELAAHEKATLGSSSAQIGLQSSKATPGSGPVRSAIRSQVASAKQDITERISPEKRRMTPASPSTTVQRPAAPVAAASKLSALTPGPAPPPAPAPTTSAHAHATSLLSTASAPVVVSPSLGSARHDPSPFRATFREMAQKGRESVAERVSPVKTRKPGAPSVPVAPDPSASKPKATAPSLSATSRTRAPQPNDQLVLEIARLQLELETEKRMREQDVAVLHEELSRRMSSPEKTRSRREGTAVLESDLELSGDAGRLSAALAAANQQLRESESMCSKLKAELAAIRGGLPESDRAAVARLEQELEAEKKLRVDAETVIQARAKMDEKVMAVLKREETAREQMRKELEATVKAAEVFQQERDSLMLQLSELRSRGAANGSTATQLHDTSLVTIIAERDQLRAELQKLAGRICTLESVEEEKNRVSKEIESALHAEMSSLTAERDRLQQEISQQAENLRQTQSSLADARRLVEDLQARGSSLAALSPLLEQARGEATILAQQVSQLQEQVSRERSEKQQISAERDELATLLELLREREMRNPPPVSESDDEEHRKSKDSEIVLEIDGRYRTPLENAANQLEAGVAELHRTVQTLKGNAQMVNSPTSSSKSLVSASTVAYERTSSGKPDGLQQVDPLPSMGQNHTRVAHLEEMLAEKEHDAQRLRERLDAEVLTRSGLQADLCRMQSALACERQRRKVAEAELREERRGEMAFSKMMDEAEDMSTDRIVFVCQLETEILKLKAHIEAGSAATIAMQSENASLRQQVDCLQRSKAALEDEVSVLKVAYHLARTPEKDKKSQLARDVEDAARNKFESKWLQRVLQGADAERSADFADWEHRYGHELESLRRSLAPLLDRLRRLEHERRKMHAALDSHERLYMEVKDLYMQLEDVDLHNPRTADEEELLNHQALRSYISFLEANANLKNLKIYTLENRMRSLRLQAGSDGEDSDGDDLGSRPSGADKRQDALPASSKAIVE